MGKGKVAAVGLVSILVVAMVVAVAVSVSNKSRDGHLSTSNKAADALCSTTDYKETCHKSLANSRDSDPKKLIQAAFEYTVENLGGVITDSTVYKDAQKDADVKASLDVCEEVLQTAVDDLKRSFDKVGEYGSNSDATAEEIVEDLKSWLSAVGTYQETCIDAFENTTGETGEKMKELLKTSKELASNGLAMLNGISSMIQTLDLSSLHSGRKLLAESERVRQLYDFNSPPAATAMINAVVAQDGSGQFKTINEALATVPPKNNRTFVIYVKAGIYMEGVMIPKKMNKIVLLGEGPTKTRITGGKNFADGVKTFHTATVGVNSDDFVAKDIGFENSAGPEKHQAVALRVSGDRAVFYNVHIDGNQDSLYAHTYRQFYRDCTISGTIDFVFGDSLSIFQNCTFVVRKPMSNQACMVTAQGRIDPRSQGAIVIQGGHIVAEPAFLATKPQPTAYLGRPWKQLSRTLIMKTEIDGFIAPEGWSPWMGTFGLDTLYYAEYMNRGLGSDTSKRVTWKGIQHIDEKTAEAWTPGRAYGGDKWITDSGATYVPGMINV